MMAGVGRLSETFDLYPPKAEATGSNPVGRATFPTTPEQNWAPSARMRSLCARSCPGRAPGIEVERAGF